MLTKDGSPTLHNKHFDETYHSTSGAITEAFEKFVKPALKFINKKDIIVLDFCFGLGYNTAALLEEISKKNHLKIIGLENDKTLLKKIQMLNPKLKYYDFIKKLKDDLVVKNDFFEIKLVLGDARNSINKLRTKFDIVFFDPFSPKKCPELWTEEVFTKVYASMNKNSVLTTYSCARVVRNNLKKAGFEVIDGPKVGRRGPSTIAIKSRRDCARDLQTQNI